MYGISRLVAVPSLARALVAESLRSKWEPLQKTLKLLVLSGETLSISLWNILHELLPNTVIINLYGSTEVWGLMTNNLFYCNFFN